MFIILIILLITSLFKSLRAEKNLAPSIECTWKDLASEKKVAPSWGPPGTQTEGLAKLKSRKIEKKLKIHVFPYDLTPKTIQHSLQIFKFLRLLWILSISLITPGFPKAFLNSPTFPIHREVTVFLFSSSGDWKKYINWQATFPHGNYRQIAIVSWWR